MQNVIWKLSAYVNAVIICWRSWCHV